MTQVKAWRLSLADYADSALQGEGARLYGGRWNYEGTPVVYFAESLALAALEVLVHSDDASQLSRYLQLPVRFDTEQIETLPRGTLPDNWREVMPPARLQALGNAWICEGRSSVLKVPSVIIPEEHTYVLNPAHPRFKEIVGGEIKPFAFDPRLVKRFAI